MSMSDDDFSAFADEMTGYHPEISEKELREIFDTVRGPSTLTDSERELSEELSRGA